MTIGWMAFGGLVSTPVSCCLPLFFTQLSAWLSHTQGMPPPPPENVSSCNGIFHITSLLNEKCPLRLSQHSHRLSFTLPTTLSQQLAPVSTAPLLGSPVSFIFIPTVPSTVSAQGAQQMGLGEQMLLSTYQILTVHSVSLQHTRGSISDGMPSFEEPHFPFVGQLGLTLGNASWHLGQVPGTAL